MWVARSSFPCKIKVEKEYFLIKPYMKSRLSFLYFLGWYISMRNIGSKITVWRNFRPSYFSYTQFDILFIQFGMERTLPFSSNFSSAVLFGFTAIPKICQHRVYVTLQGCIAFPDFISDLMVNSHFAKFLKLPVKIEDHGRVRRPSCHS